MATAKVDGLASYEAEDAIASRSSRGTLARTAMYVALAAAWIATCGSLYMSEVLGWIPCLWCWYQRIAMYPLAVILAAGLVLRDRNLPKYALCLAIPGALASVYHILLQKVPAFARFESCVVGVPCSADYLNLFGFITIPMLALAAFAIVIVACVIALSVREPAGENYLAYGPLTVLSPAASVGLIVAAIVALFVLSGAMTRSRQPAPSIATSAPAAALPAGASREAAAALYEQACAGCHGPANAGMQLIRAEYLREHSDLEVMALIRAGRSATDPDNFSGKAMPANGGQIGISDEQLAALVHYLREVRGN
ncbi:MAG: disulfide oxidoreductase [Anaerolineae bacterium]|nr:disulfide oxidoreductase [Anaerolineae bacterium]